MTNWTPWGDSQSCELIAPGIWRHETASHGGYLLSDNRMKQFRWLFPRFRTFAGGSWFEEDYDWVPVVLAFPDCFDKRHVSAAVRQFVGYYYADLHVPPTALAIHEAYVRGLLPSESA